MFTNIENISKSKCISGEASFVTDVQDVVDIFRVNLEPNTEEDLVTSFSESLVNNTIESNRDKVAIPPVSTLLEKDEQVFEHDHLVINHSPIEFAKTSNILDFGVSGGTTRFDFTTQSLTSVKAVVYHLCDGNGNSIVIY